MSHNNVAAGITLLVALLACFAARFLRAPKRGVFRAWGWAGFGIMVLCQLLLYRGVPWVATFFTPLVWTGYLLFIDALVARLRGDSRLSREPLKFLSLAFWSVPLWLIFEAYNLRLANWAYVGLPDEPVVRAIGYVWSFATIWPAIYETADFVQALGFAPGAAKRIVRLQASSHLVISLLGLLMLTLPVTLPVHVGRYLFASVWIGFVLLLDPINYRWGGRSLIGDAEAGDLIALGSFLVSGLACGILWEFWNYWAKAKWLYAFPIGQGMKIFEMPLPGYLGFPAFALECFVMYEFLGRLRKRLAGGRGALAGRETVLRTGSALAVLTRRARFFL